MRTLLFIIAMATGFCSTGQVSMDLEDFSRLQVDGNAIVEVRYGTDSKIQMATTPKDDARKMITNSSGVLRIKSDPNMEQMRVRVYTNDLDGIQAMGNARVKVIGFRPMNQLTVITKGNSTVDLGDLTVNKLVIDSSGVSAVNSKNSGTTIMKKNGKLVGSM
jgi:hypothetical protein